MTAIKKISELEQIESASNDSYILIEENGTAKRIPAGSIGGGSVIVSVGKYDTASMTGTEIYEHVRDGGTVVLFYDGKYISLSYCLDIGENAYFETDDKIYIVSAAGIFSYEEKNIGGSAQDAVLYAAQGLTAEQQAQARTNIGALAEKQAAENAQLPLVVAEDGTLTPAKLNPAAVNGAVIDSSLSRDITASWKDGHYVNGPRNAGTENPHDALTVGTTGDVVPGAEYEFTAYADPTKSPYNAFCFYNASGKAITNMEGSIDSSVWNENYYTFTHIDNTNKVYRVIAPAAAAYARYNVNLTDKESAYFRRTQAMYSMDWLVVTERNLTEESKKAVAQYAKQSLSQARLKYGHSIKKPLEFSGKSLAAFGDSITSGVSSPGLVSVDSYSRRFAAMHDMSYSAHASSGSCITDAEDAQYSIYKRITGWTGTADFAIIAGGVNDYTTGKPLGEYDSTDITTFYGSLRGICNFLSENHPNMTVIFITPINCTHNAPNAVAPLNHYRNAIFEVAAEYGFNVVDGSQLGFPDEAGGFQNYMLADGVHPTDAGHTFYAKNLCGTLC